MDSQALEVIPQLLPTAVSLIVDQPRRRLTIILPEPLEDGLRPRSFRECPLESVLKLLEDSEIPYRICPGPTGFSIIYPIYAQPHGKPKGITVLTQALTNGWIVARLSNNESRVTITSAPHGPLSSSEICFSCNRETLLEALAGIKDRYTEASGKSGLTFFIRS